MVDLQRQAAADPRALAACRPCRQPRRLDRVSGTMNTGSLLRRAEAAGTSAPPLPKVLADLRRAACRRCPAIGASSRRCRTCASAGAPSKSQYQFVVQGLEPGPSSTDWALRLADAMSRDAATFTDVTTDLAEHRPAGDGEDRPRQGRARSASRPTSCARRSTPASARGRSRPSTTTADSYQVIAEFDPRTRTGPPTGST